MVVPCTWTIVYLHRLPNPSSATMPVATASRFSGQAADAAARYTSGQLHFRFQMRPWLSIERETAAVVIPAATALAVTAADCTRKAGLLPSIAASSLTIGPATAARPRRIVSADPAAARGLPQRRFAP